MAGADSQDLDAIRTGGASGTVLVTGAAGLLGTAVLEAIAGEARRVVAIDDGSGVAAERLTSLGEKGAAETIHCDVRNRSRLAEIVAAVHPDLVVHLAAKHFIPDCVAHPEETWSINVEGTRSLLAALDNSPPGCLVFASSAAVYAPSLAPHSEDDVLAPIDVYGRSKAAGERLVRDAAARWRIRTLVLRFFNLYGPNPTTPHLIPTIIDQVRRGGSLRLGRLDARRDFVYVSDAARAVWELSSLSEGTLNVGTGKGSSGSDVVARVGDIMEAELTVERDPSRMRASERPSLVANAGRLRARLPWWPATDLDAGLRRSVQAAPGAHVVPKL